MNRELPTDPIPIHELDRRIATTLLETKAIDFEGLGRTIASVGPATILMDDDGWIRWCGNDLRIYRWPRGRLELEEIGLLREVLADVVRGKASPGSR